MLVIFNGRGTEIDTERFVIEKIDITEGKGLVTLSLDKCVIGAFKKIYVDSKDYAIICSHYLASTSILLKEFGDKIVVINLGNKGKDKELFINNDSENVVNITENHVNDFTVDILRKGDNCLTFVPMVMV